MSGKWVAGGGRPIRQAAIHLPPTGRLSARRMLGVLLIASCFLLPAFSQNLKQLQQDAAENKRLLELQQQRIQQLNRDLANLDAATTQQLKTLRGLEAEIGKLEQEKADLTKQITALGKQKADTEARIATLEKELAGLKGRLAILLQSLHREKAGRYLPLLRAQSFTDLAVRAKWVGVLGKTQTDLMDRINNTVSQLYDQRIRLQLLVEDLDKKVAQREERIKELGQARQTVAVTVTTLRQQTAGRQVLRREALQAQASLQSQLSVLQRQITAEVRRIEEEARKARARAEAERKRREEEERRRRAQAQQARTPPPPPTPRETIRELPAVPKELVGELQFPVPQGRVVEDYGSGGNTWQVIQGPSAGSPVRAAASGRVLGTFNTGNTGWTVIIQNSERINTIYTNLQDVRVGELEAITQGQLIGFSGGGALIPTDQIWFSVAVSLEGGGYRYVDPSRYY